MLIHLDPVGGIAGDMFIAAVTDAFPHLRPGLLEAVRIAGLPERVSCRFEAHLDHGLTGSRFLVDDPHERPLPVATGYVAVGGDGSRGPLVAGGHGQHHGHGPHGDHDHDHDHGHAGDHDHRSFGHLRAGLLDSALPPAVKHHAVGIFTALAQVEARIHGHAVEEVSFHELGAWDSIADVVGAAYCIATLDARAWSIGTLPLGGGLVKTAHGPLPVPVPATAALLEGYRFHDDGRAGERVTPTGAAIVRHLGCRQGGAAGERTLRCSGYGFGTRRLPGMANVLRILAFDTAAGADGQETDQVLVLTFEVDDQSPEDLATGLDHLRAVAGVLDVLQGTAFGKKGRVTACVQVLAEPAAFETVAEACFRETTTLGLRHQTVARRRLSREARTVTVEGQTLRLKRARRPGGDTVKLESDDNRAQGAATRARRRRAAETEADAADDIGPEGA